MFKLGKFLIPILELFTVNENSYHFRKDLNYFKPRAANFMVSFDVSSLYTKYLPGTETIAIILNLDRIFKDTDSFYGFDRIYFSEKNCVTTQGKKFNIVVKISSKKRSLAVTS